MNLTAIDIMAIILIVLSLIKITVLATKPKSWIKVAKFVYGTPGITTIISLILAIIILRYLLAELTIVQIFAAMLLLVPLMAISFSAFSKDMITLANKIIHTDVLKKSIVP